MKVGDLVEYIENDMGGAVTIEGQEGLIIGGPRKCLTGAGWYQWQVFWMTQCNSDGSNKIGWWDEFRLEVINEAR